MPRVCSFGGNAARAYGSSGSEAPPGQVEWTTPGTYDFVVPVGVRKLCGVSIAPGTVGYGGGLHWRNDMSVSPGETLTVIIGRSDAFAPQPACSLEQGVVYLLRTYASSTYYSSLGGGGGYGGSGFNNDPSGGGGGAGGYVGGGGNGGNPGAAPTLNSGGGQGGNPNNDGQSVGLSGRTPTFAPGSQGTPCGGGIGEGQSGGPSGIRLIWGRVLGTKRSYPDNAVSV